MLLSHFRPKPTPNKQLKPNAGYKPHHVHGHGAQLEPNPAVSEEKTGYNVVRPPKHPQKTEKPHASVPENASLTGDVLSLMMKRGRI